MKPHPHVMSLCAGALLALAAGSAGALGPKQPQRQSSAPSTPTSPLQITSVPAPPPPTNAQLAAFAGPNPAGLQSAFPAGLPPPGTPQPSLPLVPRPPVGGGGVGVAYGGYGVAAPSNPRLSAGSGYPYSAVDVARSFIQADANRDGELTRAEAQRLAIMPYSFEEMDRNHDGIITRFEYEDAVR